MNLGKVSSYECDNAFNANFLSHIKHTYSGITHYGLFPKGTIQWKISMNKAQIRDRDFLASYVESRAIPWQFEFENVKYIMTCSMDTLLMTLFLLWHRRLIPLLALKNDPSPLKEIFKLIENHQHAEARKNGWTTILVSKLQNSLNQNRATTLLTVLQASCM
jgi:hypothetical protein